MEAKPMAFCDLNGLKSSWRFAEEFAGQNGRIATLPNIIEARLATKPGDFPWENYFTTNTAEYLGYSRGGRKIIIVTHGIGPMSDLGGVINCYRYHFACPKNGGRITQQEFWNLESGKYGPVEVVDFYSYIANYEFPFCEFLDNKKSAKDILLRARLGPKADEFMNVYLQHVIEWHKSESHGWIHNPKMFELKDESNCSYLYHPIENGMAFAHLISVSGLFYNQDEILNLMFSIRCYRWGDGARVVGIKKDMQISGIDEY